MDVVFARKWHVTGDSRRLNSRSRFETRQRAVHECRPHPRSAVLGRAVLGADQVRLRNRRMIGIETSRLISTWLRPLVISAVKISSITVQATSNATSALRAEWVPREPAARDDHLQNFLGLVFSKRQPGSVPHSDAVRTVIRKAKSSTGELI